MQIQLSPVLTPAHLIVEKAGEVLTINGEAFDFSALPDGGELPADAITSEWIIGPVTRVSGELHLTLILPHGDDAPEATRFPEPITVTGDGPVDLPPYEVTP